MPRFYFHLYDDAVTLADEGLEFGSLEEAIAHALREARTIAAEQVRCGRLSLSDRIEVADENNVVLATTTFSDAVTVEA